VNMIPNGQPAKAHVTPLPPSAKRAAGRGRGWGVVPQMTQRPVDSRVPRARALRRDATEAEKKLWQHLRQPPFKAHHFRRQATMGPYFADFASHQARLVIEVDGGQHSGSASDEVRTRYLEENGYRVLRFWNNDVLENLSGVLSTIDSAVNADRPPTPDPSPPRASRAEGGEARQRKSRRPRSEHR
jgi:very-short-patch-repair endonuclease